MAHFYARISFLIGIFLGIFLAIFVNRFVIRHIKSIQNLRETSYKKWADESRISRKKVPWDVLRYTNESFKLESDYLFDKIKITCIFLVQKEENLKAAINTWGNGCQNIVLLHLEQRHKIMPSKRDKEMSSWVLLCKKLHDIEMNNIDWVLITQDTSYFIMENLRYYLAPLDVKKSHYLGHATKFWGSIYNSRNPGYVLSKRAVEHFQNAFKKEECIKNSYWNKEDYYLGKYLTQLNITPVNTLDEEQYSTFYPDNWYHVFFPGESHYKNSVYPIRCCSKRSIAFQATEGSRMYTYHYIFYKLQIFTSGNHGNQVYRNSIPESETWKQFVRSQNISNEHLSSEEYYKLWENLINDPNSFAHNLRKEDLFEYD
ncbi:hypothetical protein ABEB36_009083 [Hypothenemus hampei]|uniref:Uncharacterized protein n=1 Tax=Hypothenemus hampei TaxID=57062 RepID=A0ABD1ES21_HYPHA